MLNHQIVLVLENLGFVLFLLAIIIALIGWQNSPFQFEVAVANLGFGMIGILSFRASYGFRVATVMGNTFWLWGDATGHLYQMMVNNNLTVGNAGSWFWMDIIIPLVLLVCILRLNSPSHQGLRS